MTIASAAIHPWIGVAVILGAFVLLFAGVAVYARAGGPPEITRKLVHAGSGILTLAFPFLFRDAWPVLLLTGASAALIAAIKFLPALRRRFGGAVSGVDRSTLGELYFPVSVALVFWLTRGATEGTLTMDASFVSSDRGMKRTVTSTLQMSQDYAPQRLEQKSTGSTGAASSQIAEITGHSATIHEGDKNRTVTSAEKRSEAIRKSTKRQMRDAKGWAAEV